MKSHVNLLPYPVLRQQVVHRWLRRWFVIGCLAAAAATIALGNLWYAAQAARTQRERLEAEYRPVKKANQEIQSLRAQIAEFQQREAISMALSDDRPPLVVIGLISRAAQSCRGSVVVEHLEFKRGAVSQPKSGSTDHRLRDAGLLALSGTGQSNVAVAQFAAALRDAGIFERVELKSTQAEKNEDGDFRNYSIECVF